MANYWLKQNQNSTLWNLNTLFSLCCFRKCPDIVKDILSFIWYSVESSFHRFWRVDCSLPFLIDSQWLHFGNLKLAMVGVFTLLKLANITNQGSLPFPWIDIYQNITPLIVPPQESAQQWLSVMMLTYQHSPSTSTAQSPLSTPSPSLPTLPGTVVGLLQDQKESWQSPVSGGWGNNGAPQVNRLQSRQFWQWLKGS
jgi:hypothetical protein